jgi:hypothetical protein
VQRVNLAQLTRYAPTSIRSLPMEIPGKLFL